MKAIWNGRIIAESSVIRYVEGNTYFPNEKVNHEFLKKSSTHTRCAWKGIASYYHHDVDGKINKDAAWYYPEPSKATSKIKNHIAFWKGVEITNE